MLAHTLLLAAASHALQAPRRVARPTTLRMATEIVQFTTDLRVEDHGGLRAAATADAWLPVYCGDDADDARVARALRELDAELREKYDAPLRVVKGGATAITDVVASLNAGAVHVCADDPTLATEDLDGAAAGFDNRSGAGLRRLHLEPR